MEYKDTVRDYLERCECNLKTVVQNRGYEFTQLFSNFISCLVVIKGNRKIDEQPIEKHGLNCMYKSNSYEIDYRENTREFIRHLRNACCHYGITIMPKNNEISYVIFRDKNKKKCRDTGKIVTEKCEFEMTIKQIEATYNYLLSLI